MSAMIRVAVFTVLVFVLVIGEEVRVPERSNEACRAVTRTAQILNGARKSFIFRCRPGDDCGGVGDRFGGVIGGAFYAMQHERTFRILWPGLEHVFTPHSLNWTFNPVALQLPYLDENGNEIDKSRVTDNLGGKIYTDVVGSDVGVVNDLNTRQIVNGTDVAIIEKYRHVYFHSNRGPNEEMYRAVSTKNKWPQKESLEKNYAAHFYCVFDALFRPAEAFLKTEYRSMGREPMLFSHLMRIVEDPEVMSISFHHRVDDGTAQANGDADMVTDAALARIVEIYLRHRDSPTRKANLFFVSNSIASMRKVMDSAVLKQTFNQVYCQELSAQIHVADAGHIAHPRGGLHVSHPAVLSTQQAFRDWWIMRQSAVLIGGQSGFSKSAALFAAAKQIRYEDEGNAYREDYWVMCGSRFC